MWRKRTLEQQLYLFQILSIILAILLSLGVALYFSLQEKQESLDSNISNAAAIVSSMPEVAEALRQHRADEPLIEYMDKLTRQLRYVDVITICGMDSIRIYHTNRAQIGEKFVGGDESDIVSGSAPYIVTGTGTLGRQRRAFYPVMDAEGVQIGFVMASVLTASISRLRTQIILTFLMCAAILMAFGTLMTSHFFWKLKKTLLGFHPEQIRKIYIERAEVLDAMEEGIFAVNTKGRILLMNKSARNMLELEDMPQEGTKITDIFEDDKLQEVIQTGIGEYDISLMLHDKNIMSSRIPIIEDGNVVGAVSIFRNRTEVTKLAEELTGAKYMVDTLRAFNHEFMNKLHVILGYIEMGEPEKVTELILNTSLVSTQAVSEVTRKIQISALAALLIGKIIRANELGIKLTLKHDSRCSETGMNLPVDTYITIIGNLVENAIEELNRSSIPVKEIEVGVNIWENGCILSVDDTGNGIPEELQEKIFEQGFSTKGENRGTGMYLIKQLVERYQGTLSLDSETGVGTSVTVTITA